MKARSESESEKRKQVAALRLNDCEVLKEHVKTNFACKFRKIRTILLLCYM